MGAVRPDPKPGPALGAKTATDEGWDLELGWKVVTFDGDLLSSG